MALAPCGGGIANFAASGRNEMAGRQEGLLERYHKRAGVEGTLSQGIRAFGMRQSRYIGLAKTGFQEVCMAAAINVLRVVRWLAGVPRAKTRVRPTVERHPHRRSAETPVPVNLSKQYLLALMGLVTVLLDEAAAKARTAED